MKYFGVNLKVNLSVKNRIGSGYYGSVAITRYKEKSDKYVVKK